jgi:histidine triad (HIT) family protein
MRGVGRAVPECLFCRIAAGSIPAHIVHEDELVIAFLDIGPIRPGHTQIIPRQHFDYFEDLPDEIAARILQIGQRLAKSMKALYGVDRVGFVFTGGDIAHAHAHVVPMHEPTDITSRRYITNAEVNFAALPQPDAEEMRATAEKLRRTLNSTAF